MKPTDRRMATRRKLIDELRSWCDRAEPLMPGTVLWIRSYLHGFTGFVSKKRTKRR